MYNIKAMSVSALLFAVCGCSALGPNGSEYVLVGESNAGGSDAARKANLAIGQADSHGCQAISVGGYATGGEGLIIGIPVLVRCPSGIAVDEHGNLRTP